MFAPRKNIATRLGRRLKSRHVVCAILLLVHAALCVFYSLNTPLWESYDETGHYSYARYIATHGALPPDGTVLARFNETHQPPLYYALVAIPISLVDTSDNVQPRFAIGGGVYVVPDERIDAFPYRGTALALRLGRMVSVLLSTLAVALTYLTVRTALPRRVDVALLATALYALWPMALIMGGTITNDIGMALWGSLTLLFVTRLYAKSATRSRRADYVGLAFSLAGAVMTKDSAIALLLFGMVAVTALVARDTTAPRGYGKLIAELAYLVVPLTILIVAGTLVSEGRSLRQFGQTTSFASNLFIAPPPPPPGPAHIGPPSTMDKLFFFVDNFLAYLWRMTFETTFGTFGWGLLRMPNRWYDLAIAGALVATAGLAWFMLRARALGARALGAKARHLPLLLMLMLACVALAPTVRTINSADLSLLNGRFLLPGLGALTILLAMGLLAFPRPIARASTTFVLCGIALISIMSPWVVIQPFYQKPALLDPGAIPGEMKVPFPITYGDAIKLLGYSLPAPKAWRGDYAGITLYWRALKPMANDYGLRVENFSLDGLSFRNGLNFTPGHSVYPTSFWRPGDTFAETYYLPIGFDAPAPTLATFKVTWFDQKQNDVLQQSLMPVCQDGAACEPKFSVIAVGLDRNDVSHWAKQPAYFRLGQQVELIDIKAPTAAHPGQAPTVMLVWRATASGLPALTTFVHVLAPDGRLVAQADAPPRGGNYPTNVWSAGEIIPDHYTLRLDSALPPGTYRLRLGMYDPNTVERLPAFDAAGAPLQDNAIPLPDLTVR